MPLFSTNLLSTHTILTLSTEMSGLKARGPEVLKVAFERTKVQT